MLINITKKNIKQGGKNCEEIPKKDHKVVFRVFFSS